MKASSELNRLAGVGPESVKKLAALGVTSLQDLATYYPRRYDDYSDITPINKIRPGIVSIKARIRQVSGRYVRRGMHITEAVASDDTGSVRLVWFNQPYRSTAIKPAIDYYISGQFELSRQRLSIMNPSVEISSGFQLNTARIVPIYRETKGLKSAQIRAIISQAIKQAATTETLPEWLLRTNDLLCRYDALFQMHFPDSPEMLMRAKKRLGFEEVFELTLAALLNKQDIASERALSIPFDERLAKDFVANLPFALTDAQRKVVWQIYQNMQKQEPMNRLVEGDVGSGKTVIATMAALMVIRQGFQVALMAPTELLARQHAETIHRLLQPLGMDSNVGLLVGSLTPKQKATAHKRIASGEINFVIGTQALIAEKVDMHRLGLIIIDEQHRFGVEQRKKLQAKAGHMPHALHLTATPIPRSLALTLYGELDVSILDTKPAGRKSILTKICSPNSRDQLYKQLEKQLDVGRQLFVVCPQIAPLKRTYANNDNEDEEGPASAEAVYETFRSGYFKQRQIGLLHGKMKSAEKQAIMKRFISGELEIMVSTTVIEVGVDVPNATVMLIEAAERFGLAQIHQLRGRVGRSQHQGYCYLMLSDSKAPGRRLRALEQSTDGFELAELDLEIRGPGAIYGTSQHGQLDLRVAKLSDLKLIAAARTAAAEFISRQENLLQYPHLNANVSRLRSVSNLS